MMPAVARVTFEIQMLLQSPQFDHVAVCSVGHEPKLVQAEKQHTWTF